MNQIECKKINIARVEGTWVRDNFRVTFKQDINK